MPKVEGIVNLRSARTPEQLALLAEARKDAEEVRSAWLVGLRQGMFEVNDLVEAAQKVVSCRNSEEHGPRGEVCDFCGVDEPLLKVRLKDILNNVPEWGAARSRRIFERFVTIFTTASSDRIMKIPERPTLSWLVNCQARDNRLGLWRDALDDRRELVPWAGFPFTPCPEGAV